MATKKQTYNDAVAQGRSFFRTLASEGVMSTAYLLTGDELFLVDEAIVRLEQSLFPGGRNDFNYSFYAAQTCRAADVISACEMLPMMAQRRLVVVRGVDTWPAAELQSLSKYVPGMSPTTVLVMEARKLDERMAASKQLHAAVQHTVFVELQERDLYPWLVRQARQRGLELGRDVPETLVATIGTSLSLLSMAIERIDLFVGPSLEAGLRPVTLERMAPIIADGRARTVFELTDQVVAGNVGAAMDSLHRLLLAGDSPVGINAMLARQFRQFHQVSAGRRAGLSGEGLARFVGVPGFRLQDTLRAADAYGLATSEQAIHLLMQTDRLLKSSRLKDTIIVERAILQLCMARRTNLTA